GLGAGLGNGLGDGLGAGLSDGPGDGPGQLPAPDVRQHGILETVASADGVLSAARRLGLTASSTEQVFDAARSGDQAAIQVVHDEASHLARALAAVIAVLDPGLIVIGGGVGGNADLLL